MWPSPLLVVFFETSDFAFMTGLLLSSLLLFLAALYILHQGRMIDGGWITALFSLLEFIVLVFLLLYFKKLYLII